MVKIQKFRTVIPESGKRWPLFLLGLYIVEFLCFAISPYDRTVWLAENLTAWIPIFCLCLFYWRDIRFSNTAYTLMALFFLLHTVGGYYTFERVPMDWITDFFDFRRNHFDRICHFLVGVFAFAMLEYSDRNHLIRGRKAAAFLTVMSIFGFSAIFELVEWFYAELADPAAGNAFLGSQGDVWDAQKDMLADGLGAIVFTVLYAKLRWFRKKTNHD